MFLLILFLVNQAFLHDSHIWHIWLWGFFTFLVALVHGVAWECSKAAFIHQENDRRIMVIRELLGFLTYLLTYKRSSQLLFLLEFLMCYDVTLSADKGSLFFLGIVNGCRIRIGIPVGNAVGIAWIYQVSYSELHPRGLLLYTIQTFFHFLLHFYMWSSNLGQNAKLHPLHSSF